MKRRVHKEHVARAIVSNNLTNSLFMVLVAGLAMALIRLGLTIPQIFLVAAIMNLGAAAYVCKLLPSCKARE